MTRDPKFAPGIDVAKEPVDLTTDDGSYMDTGVLHEERICVECGNDLACQGYRKCSDCMEADPDGDHT